jgi:hypothetical protein
MPFDFCSEAVGVPSGAGRQQCDGDVSFGSRRLGRIFTALVVATTLMLGGVALAPHAHARMCDDVKVCDPKQPEQRGELVLATG